LFFKNLKEGSKELPPACKTKAHETDAAPNLQVSITLVISIFFDNSYTSTESKKKGKKFRKISTF